MDTPGILQISRPFPLPPGTLFTVAQINAAIEKFGPLPHLVEGRNRLGGAPKDVC